MAAQDPDAREEVARDSVVRLTLARGQTTVAVPPLVGLTAVAAKSRLRSLGLHWTVAQAASEEATATVVGQTPGIGADVRKGAAVTLRVSSGPTTVSVPDVTGMDAAAARAELESAGFVVNVVEQATSDPAEDGTVVAQDPAGGADAEKGSLVNITVALRS